MKGKFLCIIQARFGSTRLPGKVLMEIAGRTLLEHVVNRVRLAKKIDKIVLATTEKPEDDQIFDLCRRINVDCFRGSEDDVLSRYKDCSDAYPEYENIVRVTGDCPVIDPQIIDQTVDFFANNNFDFVSNVEKPTFPDGMDVEIFSRQRLLEASAQAQLASEREHVGMYFRKNPDYKIGNYTSKSDFSNFRLTVDNQDDFAVVKFVIENSRPDDSYLDYISLLKKNPNVMAKNSHIKRNEGLEKSLRND